MNSRYNSVNMRMKHIVGVIGLCVITSVCYAQENSSDYDDPQNMKIEPEHTDCHKLPKTFESMEQAVTLLEATRFNLDENFKTTRKSGLMRARFVSCDFKQGYLMVHYDGKDQIYPNVEPQLWEEFRSTADIDGYYIKKIAILPTIEIP